MTDNDGFDADLTDDLNKEPNMDIPQITSKSDAKSGAMGQQYLATGKQVALRRWEEAPCDFSDPTCRDYETVGYMLEGVLKLDLDGETVTLRTGDSWLVPQGAQHRYRINERIIAIEATSPPARFNDRDEPPTDKS
ncbi:MAG: cupin domain-containing protein [Rubripirellula sp.]